MLSNESVARIVAAAVIKANELGIAGSIAVVDDGGNLKGFLRMDGSVLGSSDGAQRKARTAAVSGMSTADWFDMVSGDAATAALFGAGMEGALFLPGGVPLAGGGPPIGGVGFAGGLPAQDVEVVEAAVAAIDDDNS